MKRTMGALTGALFVLAAQVLPAQMARYAFVIAPTVRDSLARAWDDSTPRQNERGYCLAYQVRAAPFGVTKILLTRFVTPDSTWAATPYSIAFRCPPNTLDLHTHTPVTCPMAGAFDRDYKHCRAGGEDAYICYASGMDQLSLTAVGRPVAFIQCSRHAILPYFPFRTQASP